MTNAKNERIKKMWERGIRDPRIIAKKLGYSGNSVTAGIERVHEGLVALGIEKLSTA
jgi:DNA-binding CsgD family transcriptional regulator